MNSITPEGKQKLEAELQQLKERRVGVIERLKSAKELGDLSENSEYTEARDTQGSIDMRIMEIEQTLKNCTVTSGPTNKDIVEIGNKVELKGPKGVLKFTIVGSVEADPSAGEISNESPIGQAVMGRKVGDKVTAELPTGAVEFTIKSIA